MTVASETTKASYSGDGSTVTFVVPFYFLAADDLLVVRRNADGSETILARTTDYSVSGAGNPAGGSITCSSAPASGTTLLILRHEVLTQGLSLLTSSVFPAASVEQELDRLTMLIQQLSERIDRRPGLLVSTSALTPNLDDPVANRALVYSGDGTRIISGPTTTEISSAQTYAQNAAASAAIAVAAAGYKYVYSNSTSASDPGAGFIRFDNVSLASATKLYISETTGAGQSIATDIATWDDQTSVNKGRLRVFKQTDPSIFALFNVTGANTDNGLWDALNISYVGGSGILSNNDSVTIEFFQSGDKGDTGATGSTGPAGSVPIAAAGGTADALTASYSPNLALLDKTVCIVVPASDNTSATPTFSPDGLASHAITKTGGGVLVAGDIKALKPALLEYNLANARWELMNPVFPPAQTGDVATVGTAATIQSQAVTYSKVQNVSATSRILGRKTAGAGSLEECTLSQILDFIGSAAQGDILYRDASGWARLPAGVSGQFLKTLGPGANPGWANSAGATIDIQTFTANGTWTKPAGLTGSELIAIEIWDGGASGGSRSTTGSGGGGSGGCYHRLLLTAVQLSATESITVGAQVAGVSGLSNGNNSNRSSVTINGVTFMPTTVAASGGVHGAGTTSAGHSTMGTISTIATIIGEAGQTSVDSASPFVPAAGTFMKAGQAGATACSTAANGGNGGGLGGIIFSTGVGGVAGTAAGGNGGNGVAPGGGGGGAVNGGTSGAGARGHVIVTTFKS